MARTIVPSGPTGPHSRLLTPTQAQAPPVEDGHPRDEPGVDAALWLRSPDLVGAAAWARMRPSLVGTVRARRAARTLAPHPALRLSFENRDTIRWQAQEVARIDRLERPEDLAEELARYAVLTPGDRATLCATLIIGIDDAEERAQRQPMLAEAAHHLRLAAVLPPGESAPGRANTDLADGHRGRPGGVHFLRFTLPPGLHRRLLRGDALAVVCDHPSARFAMPLPPATLAALREDLS